MKIKIHPLTMLLFFISFLTGYAKYLFFIFLIVIIHETGHIVFAKIFKRHISKVEFLPFGGLLKIDSLISMNIFEDLLIAVGGIFAQCLFGFYLRFLNAHCTINASTFEFLQNYNILIMLFNLIPICPLDGYKVLKLLLETSVPFSKTFKIMRWVSILVLGFLILWQIDTAKNNIFIVIFLIVTLVQEHRNEKYIMNRFFIERLNYDFDFKRKNIKNYKNMFKNRLNFIDGVHEKLFLAHFFERKMY